MNDNELAIFRFNFRSKGRALGKVGDVNDDSSKLRFAVLEFLFFGSSMIAFVVFFGK